MALTKTDLGQHVLKDRLLSLTQRQRAALILFDGKRGDREVLAASGATPEDIEHLQALGLVTDPAFADAPTVPASLDALNRGR